MRSLPHALAAFLVLALGCAEVESKEREQAYAVAASPSPARSVLSSAWEEPTPSPSTGRIRILNASVRLSHPDPTSLEEPLRLRAESLGGYVDASYAEEGLLNLTLRIPAERLEAFLDSLAELGRLESRSLSSTDITQSYRDLEVRLQNQRLLVERVRRYLGEAKTIEEILKVESHLAEATSQLESMLAQKLAWDRDVSLSRVELQVTSTASGQTSAWPDWLRGWEGLVQLLVWTGYFVIFGSLYFVLAGIPLLSLVFLLYRHLWVRPGWFRRLWERPPPRI